MREGKSKVLKSNSPITSVMAVVAQTSVLKRLFAKEINYLVTTVMKTPNVSRVFVTVLVDSAQVQSRPRWSQLLVKTFLRQRWMKQSDNRFVIL